VNVESTHESKTDRATRVSVVADVRLLEDLRAHQRRVREESGMRVSLSQVAGSLLRRGLDQAASAAA
jgi:hypothetical protein